jgi:hypothetical protein
VRGDGGGPGQDLGDEAAQLREIAVAGEQDAGDRLMTGDRMGPLRGCRAGRGNSPGRCQAFRRVRT